MPTFTTLRMRLPVCPVHCPPRTRVAERGHAVEHVVHARHDVHAVDDDLALARRAQRGVQHGAVLGHVDLVAAEHRVDAVAQPAFVREVDEKPHGVVSDAMLGVVEEPAGRRHGEMLGAARVGGEQLAQLGEARVLEMLGQRDHAGAGSAEERSSCGTSSLGCDACSGENGTRDSAHCRTGGRAAQRVRRVAGTGGRASVYIGNVPSTFSTAPPEPRFGEPPHVANVRTVRGPSGRPVVLPISADAHAARRISSDPGAAPRRGAGSEHRPVPMATLPVWIGVDNEFALYRSEWESMPRWVRADASASRCTCRCRGRASATGRRSGMKGRTRDACVHVLVQRIQPRRCRSRFNHPRRSSRCGVARPRRWKRATAARLSRRGPRRRLRADRPPLGGRSDAGAFSTPPFAVACMPYPSANSRIGLVGQGLIGFRLATHDLQDAYAELRLGLSFESALQLPKRFVETR